MKKIYLERGMRGIYKGFYVGAFRGYSFLLVQYTNDAIKKLIGEPVPR
jgi:hypothetical protein